MKGLIRCLQRDISSTFSEFKKCFLLKETIAAVKSEKRLLGNDGEVPISDASGPSTSSHGKMSQCPEVLEVTDAEIRPCSKSPTDEKFPERKKELDDESEIEYSK